MLALKAGLEGKDGANGGSLQGAGTTSQSEGLSNKPPIIWLVHSR